MIAGPMLNTHDVGHGGSNDHIAREASGEPDLQTGQRRLTEYCARCITETSGWITSSSDWTGILRT